MKTIKRSITAGGVLQLINDLGEDFFPLAKYDAWKNAYGGRRHLKQLEDYFPSHIERSVKGLLRKGWVEKINTADGIMVRITILGREQMLFYDLEKIELKKNKWDGKWRMVLFDIEELNKRKRNQLRKYLKQMKLYQMQESAYVTPYDCEKEIKYIREILNIPHGVKIGVLESLENSEDLEKVFGL